MFASAAVARVVCRVDTQPLAYFGAIPSTFGNAHTVLTKRSFSCTLVVGLTAMIDVGSKIDTRAVGASEGTADLLTKIDCC